MAEHAAFLRGMNVGGHRITNDQLRAHLSAMGLREVATFRASGNVVFDGGSDSPPKMQELIEQGLLAALGYAVPTFVRNRDEVLEIAEAKPIEQGSSKGKLQVGLLAEAPSAKARKAVLEMQSEADLLAFGKRELYWLPQGPMSDSELDFKAIDRLLGVMTVRTKNTIEQIAARYFAP
jgi:uncharacterized protein (DUF1697 family)